MDNLKKIKFPEFENLSDTTVAIIDINSIVGIHDSFVISNNQNNVKWISFAQGKKNAWCVYLFERYKNPETNCDEIYCFIPKDTYYFERINWLGTLSAYGITPEMVYGHLYYIYVVANQYKKTVSHHVIETINAIVNQYYIPYNKIANFNFSEFVRELFMLIYATMVAEEFYINSNGQPTAFGSLIKILALHKILINHEPYKEIAACYNCIQATNIISDATKMGIVRV